MKHIKLFEQFVAVFNPITDFHTSFITDLAFIMIIGAIVTLAFFYTNSSQDNVRISQVTNFGNKIISSAETVFYSGEPSKTTISTYLPEGVENITIAENTLYVSVLLLCIISNSKLTSQRFLVKLF